MTKTTLPVPSAPTDGITETVQETSWMTPYQDPKPALIAFLARAAVKGATMRVMIYGCTWEPFFEAVVNARRAGADVKIIYDHTQACGPKEHQHIEDLVKEGFVDGVDFLIGTSPVKREIVHTKQTAIWTPDGECWVETGSLNYSDSAFLQCNTVEIKQSAIKGAFIDSAFNREWQFIQTHEQLMQLQGAAA